jgi:hypothetical protein
MNTSREVQIIPIGPIARKVRDPRTMADVKIDGSLRLYVRVVDPARVPGLAWLHENVQKAIYEEIVRFSREMSCALYLTIAEGSRRDLESRILAKLRDAFVPMGLAALAIDTLVLTMDPKTEAWLRSQDPPVPPSEPPGPPSSRLGEQPTQVAGRCMKCGAQLEPGLQRCPACGGSIIPPPQCARCGTLIRPGARFCSHCGAPRV